MKYELRNNKLVAMAETREDEMKLLDLKYPTQRVTTKTRKHKKHTFMKTCVFCGEKFKGNRGVGVHMAKCKQQPQITYTSNIPLPLKATNHG